MLTLPDMAKDTDSAITNAEENEQLYKHEHQLRNKNVLIVILVVGLLSSTIIIFVVYYNARNMQKKNKTLYAKVEELSRSKTDSVIIQSQEEPVSYDSSAAKPPSYELNNELFERLEKLMGEKKVYLNSDFNRKILFSELTTNELYLSRAIRQATNMTIHEYLNSLRLEHAVEMLTSSEQTIETIAHESGFSSTRSFYRLFKEKYGLSPSGFRDTTKEIV